MLLCDAAQEAAGKLYILGAGWSQIRAPGIPVNMALAVKLSIPWDQANKRTKIVIELVDDDGERVQTGDGTSIVAEGELEVGRPPGLKPGTDLDVPMVFNFNGLALDAGGYVWTLTANKKTLARAPMRVAAG